MCVLKKEKKLYTNVYLFNIINFFVILTCMVSLFCFKIKNYNFFIVFNSIEYLEFFSFFILISIICCVLFFISYFLSPKIIYSEKVSSYECGFEPFDDARKTFDIHFYLVAILFLIFDLEVAFLLPWAVVLGEIGLFGF
jgi:NADH-quinone oxidoreductase subunit A